MKDIVSRELNGEMLIHYYTQSKVFFCIFEEVTFEAGEDKDSVSLLFNSAMKITALDQINL